MAGSSYIVDAARVWADELAAPPHTPRGLWGFGVHTDIWKEDRIGLQTVAWNLHTYDYEFEYNFNDSTKPHAGEFTIFNISDDTLAKLHAGDYIEGGGGYLNDLGYLFGGHITEIKTKWDNADKATTFRFTNRRTGVGDTGESTDSRTAVGEGGTRIERTYGARVGAAYILEDLCNATGLPVAEFTAASDRVFDNAVTVEGDINSKISEYAQMCGVWAYVVDGQLYVKDLRLDPPATYLLNSSAGLIGAPTPFEEEVKDTRTEDSEEYITYKGYDVKMLMNHRITTGVGVRLDSRAGQGLFTVKSGKHTFDGTNAITEARLIERPV